MQKELIISFIFIFFLSNAYSHVESGFFRSFTPDGYEIIYYWEPVRPKVNETVKLRITVKWYDLQNPSLYLLPPGEEDRSQIKVGAPVKGLGAFVEVYSRNPSVLLSDAKSLGVERLGRIFMKEIKPGNFEAEWIFNEPGSYKIRFVITDKKGYFQIDAHDHFLFVEPKSPSFMFLAYILLFIGIGMIFSKLNEMKMEQLRGKT